MNCDWEENLSVRLSRTELSIRSERGWERGELGRDWHCGLGLRCAGCWAGMFLFGTNKSSGSQDSNSCL